MKILQINATYGIGSTGTIVRDIQKSCHDSGLECFVAYSLADESVPNGYKIGNWFSNKLHALLSRISGKQGYFSYLPTLFFIRYLRHLQPDIVHLHNLHSNFINLPLLLRYLAKNDIKTIITLHDCWWYTGGCFHYTHAGCDRWLMGCGNCPKKKQDNPAYIFDKSASILDDRKNLMLDIPRLTIVGVSNWISDEARKTFLSVKSIVTVHNGIDPSIFKPTPSHIRKDLGLEDKFIILGPASKWLLDINKDILDDFTTRMQDDEVLLLYGACDENCTLPPNVKLYGFTRNRKELAELYSCADVFVNTSWEDSLSLINLEAQACGTPVITIDSTAPRETVDNLYSKAVKLERVSCLYEEVNILRSKTINDNKVREFVQKNFSEKESCKKYIEIYLN